MTLIIKKINSLDFEKKNPIYSFGKADKMINCTGLSTRYIQLIITVES